MYKKNLARLTALCLTAVLISSQPLMDIYAAGVYEEQGALSSPDVGGQSVSGAGAGTEPDRGDAAGDSDKETADSYAISADIVSPDSSDEILSEQAAETDAVSGDEAPDAQILAESALPEGINGMPEGYVLSEKEKKRKQSLAEHRVAEAVADMEPGVDYAKDRVICLADSKEEAEQVAQAYGGTLSGFSYGVAVISLADADITVKEAVELAEDTDNNLPAVEPDYYTTTDDGDTLIGSSQYEVNRYQAASAPVLSTWSDIRDYGFDDPFLDPKNERYQWMHEQIGSYGAWGVTTGSSNVTVAVIGTGVNADHEEFKGKSSVSSPDIRGTGDGSGDAIGTGTYMAGIIAGSAANAAGGAGIAPGAGILALRADDASGKVVESNVIKAIRYVSGWDEDGTAQIGEREADIINVAYVRDVYSESLKAAIDEAYEAGVTVVAPMGDDLANNIRYPAAYDHVIAVCATDAAGLKTYNSSYGSWADIAAPGQGIYSAYKGNTSAYTAIDGTYAASAVISGACALYMSALGHVSPDTMERVLKSSAKASQSKNIGAGIIDISAMFASDRSAPVISVRAKDTSVSADVTYGTARDGQTVSATAKVPADGRLIIERAEFNGDGSYQGASDTGDRNRAIIIYTTDGKMPAIKDGIIQTGQQYADEIALSTLLGDSGKAKQVTVKAACVTGMGVMGKVSTLSFTIDPAAEADSSRLATGVSINDVPKRLIAGKTYTFKATVSPNTLPQKVTWRIVSYEDGDLSKAKIGTANGTLTTVGGQSGVLIVECTSSDGNAKAQARINVVRESSGKLYPTGTIALNPPLKTLYNGGSDEDRQATISIGKLEDTTGERIDPDDVSFLWTSSNAKVVSVEPQDGGKSAVITAAGKGKAAVTCKVLDGSGKQATCNVTVNQYVESIDVTGQRYIIQGGTAAYKATVTPATANNKAVEWSLNGAPGGVSIDKKTGKVTVGSMVASGLEFEVVADAMDGSEISGTADITVISRKAASVAVTTTESEAVSHGATTLKKKLKNTDTEYIQATAVTLCEKDTESMKLDALMIALSSDGATELDITDENLPVWTSSDPKVAEVESTDGGRTATVTGLTKGKATITCAARDGSGKKAAIAVTVARPLEEITVTGQKYIAKGGSATYKAAVLPADASNKAVEWIATDAGGQTTDDVSITPAGKLTVKTTATGSSYRVVAKAKDGYGAESAPFEVIVSSKKANAVAVTVSENEIAAHKIAATSKTLKNTSTEYLSVTSVTLYDTGMDTVKLGALVTGLADDRSETDITGESLPVWTSGNPKVASVVSNDGGKTVTVTGLAKGQTKITCAAQDGSGKKAVITVVVAKPVEEITVTGQRYIARGGQASYKAQVTPATANDRGVVWSIKEDTHKGITINSSTGAVKVEANAAKDSTFHVVASAKDGSGVSGEAVFTVTGDRVNAVEISTEADNEAYEIKRSNDSITSLKLFTETTNAETPVNITAITLKGEAKYLDTYPENMLKWTSSNPKIVKVTQSADGESATISALAKGTAKITCEAQDGSGKKASLTVTVAVPVEEITVTGQTYIVRGKSAIYKAQSVLPKTAGNRTVEWSLSGAPGGVSIDKKTGKVTVGIKVASGSEFKVVARAKDGSGITGELTVRVHHVLTGDVRITPATSTTYATYDSFKIKSTSSTLTSAQLFTVDTGRYAVDESEIKIWGTAYYNKENNSGKEMMKWTSSNPKIAYIYDESSSNNGSLVTIKAKSAGNVTITCEAMDGSGKKATTKISVIVPVSDITVEPAKGMTNIVGCGKSVTSSVRYGSLYGKPTAKKGATWSYEIAVMRTNRETGDVLFDKTYNSDLKKAKLFTQSGSKLTAGSLNTYTTCIKKYLNEDDDDYTYDLVAIVTAKATDGSGAENDVIYRCCPMAKKIGIYDYRTGVNIAQSKVSMETGKTNSLYYVKSKLSDDSLAFIPEVKPTVVSSDTSIATAYCDDNGKLVIVSGKKTGTATLTITANDGSGVKCTFKVTVTAG